MAKFSVANVPLWWGSAGVLPSSCGVGLLSYYDVSGSSSLVGGTLSLVVVCRLLSSFGGCIFLVVAGGSKLVSGYSQFSICGWDSSLVVVGGTSQFAVVGSSRVFNGGLICNCGGSYIAVA